MTPRVSGAKGDDSATASASATPASTSTSTSTPAANGKGKGKGKGKGRAEEDERDRQLADEVREMENETSSYGGSHTDITVPLEPRETPRIEANRAMRGEPVAGPSTPKNRARRSSGKRASMGGDSNVISVYISFVAGSVD